METLLKPNTEETAPFTPPPIPDKKLPPDTISGRFAVGDRVVLRFLTLEDEAGNVYVPGPDKRTFTVEALKSWGGHKVKLKGIPRFHEAGFFKKAL